MTPSNKFETRPIFPANFSFNKINYLDSVFRVRPHGSRTFCILRLMKKNLKPIVGLVLLLILGIYILVNRQSSQQISIQKNQDSSLEVESQKSDTVANSVKEGAPIDPHSATAASPNKDSEQSAALLLNKNNFEDFIHRCFQGEACELDEDPEKIYQYFKQSGKRDANDLFISFLRSKLKDSEFAKRYKNVLKKMIDDFYPHEELQFQQAAYYNYLGDLKKSLDLYLDLQKKAARDSSLRNAPNLNIANTYYDLGQYREALPYYQLSLDEYINRKQEVAVPSQNEMIGYIEGRIRDIKSKLGV